jgi:hypothetical protein
VKTLAGPGARGAALDDAALARGGRHAMTLHRQDDARGGPAA